MLNSLNRRSGRAILDRCFCVCVLCSYWAKRVRKGHPYPYPRQSVDTDLPRLNKIDKAIASCKRCYNVSGGSWAALAACAAHLLFSLLVLGSLWFLDSLLALLPDAARPWAPRIIYQTADLQARCCLRYTTSSHEFRMFLIKLYHASRSGLVIWMATRNLDHMPKAARRPRLRAVFEA
jgi:hypothetical protein